MNKRGFAHWIYSKNGGDKEEEGKNEENDVKSTLATPMKNKTKKAYCNIQ